MRANTSTRARHSSPSGPRRWPIRASRRGWRGAWRVADLIVAFDLPSGREALALAERLAKMALHAGLAGVVASGREVAFLREALGPGPRIVVPGIRAEGDARGDQSRTVSATEAARGGATHLVVGRPITQAKDPAAVY